jgi:hypothetical protein
MSGVKTIATLVTIAGLISFGPSCERHKKLTIEHSPVPVTKPTEQSEAANPTFAQSSEATRLALVEHCGKCHQSTLSSHKPGAIAVFDLDAMAAWHDKLVDGNLGGIDKRTKNKPAVTDNQRTAILEFLALKQEQLQ